MLTCFHLTAFLSSEPTTQTFTLLSVVLDTFFNSGVSIKSRLFPVELRTPALYFLALTFLRDHLEIFCEIHLRAHATSNKLVTFESQSKLYSDSSQDGFLSGATRSGVSPGLHRAHSVFQCSPSTTESPEAARYTKHGSCQWTVYIRWVCLTPSPRAASQH